MARDKSKTRRLSRDPQGSAFFIRLLLVSSSLLATVAVISGCASMAGREKSSNRWLESQDSPPAYAMPPRWPVTTQPALSGRPTTLPDAAGARGELDRAVQLATRLNFRQARAVLANLEGRLLLARDLDGAPEAAFWLAFCDEKLGQCDQACQEYQRVLERYPDSPQADTASARLSRLRPIHARPAID
jgi:hypothetical protein